MTRPATIHSPLTGEHITFVRTGRDTGGELLVAELRLAPGGWVPRHAHLRVSEALECVSGDVLLRLGGRDRRLGPGDRVDVPRRTLHLLRNVGEETAVLHLEVRPARHMETLMRAMFATSRAAARIFRRPRDDRRSG